MAVFKIGFVGLGTMGESMCENIIRKGYAVWLYDINKDQVKKLAKKGGNPCNSLKEIAEKSNVIISMLPTNENVREVVEGLIPYMKPDTIYIDMSTISPEVSKKLAEKIRNAGSIMLDVPVVRSKAAAVEGKLGIYVGGDYKTFVKIKPILECMGKPEEIIYFGPNGSGLAMKMCHNMLVGIVQNGVNEMILVAKEAGLEYDRVIQGIRAGGGQNYYLDSKAESIKKGDFSPKFSFKNMQKDMHLIVEFAEKLGLNLIGAKKVLEIYDIGIEEYGLEDFSASIKVVEKLVKK